MKVISAIIAFYMTGLISLPCADVLTGDSCGTEVHLHQQPDNPTDFGHDLCSPFCSCHCCHVHTIKSAPSKLDYHATLLSHSPANQHNKNCQVDYPHWKPPKV